MRLWDSNHGQLWESNRRRWVVCVLIFGWNSRGEKVRGVILEGKGEWRGENEGRFLLGGDDGDGEGDNGKEVVGEV